MIFVSDQAVVVKVYGDHGDILSCVVLGMTSGCEDIDDSPTPEETYAYQMRLRHRVGDMVTYQILNLRLRNGVPIADLLTT